MVPSSTTLFDGNGAIGDLFEELATNCVRDHHLLMVVPPWTRVESSAWVVTATIERAYGGSHLRQWCRMERASGQ